MEVQSESAEPSAAVPCDSQPSGKINKAAFKLFGKRRSGAGMAGFFSFRNKGAANGNLENGSSANGNSANGNSVVDLVRSRTHDGLTSERGGEETGSQEAGPVRSLSKSLSFFSLFRRGSARVGESSGSAFGRRGRGLKGLFSSFRWRRKDRALEGEVEVAEGREVREEDILVPEELKDVTLTLEPQPHLLQEDPESLEAEPGSCGEEAPASAAVTPTHHVAVTATPSESPYTPVASPLRAPPALSEATTSVPSVAAATPILEHVGTADPPSEPSVDRLCSLLFTDVTSLKSFDSLTGCGDIIADAEEEGGANGGSGTSSSSSGGGHGAGGGGGRTGILSAIRRSPAKPPASPPVRHSSLPAAAPPAPLPARARVPPPPPQQPSGSGVVAYMGGGEEMASPDGVDDADMQGLWHMLPSTGDESPALARPHPPTRSTPVASNPNSTAFRSAERRPPQVKALGLSKIPVVGGGVRAAKPPLPHGHARYPASPHEKEPLSDEGYWDTPTATPMATPDDGGMQKNQRIGLSRDSCSGDHLYDLYNDPEEDAERSEEEEEEEEDLTSTPSPSAGDCKLSPPSQATPPTSSSSSSFHSMKGSASLPRESKIPVCLKQTTPPHSVSQSALSSVLEVGPPPPKTQAPPPARTRIPVSKVPVRRSGNKPGNATRGPTHRK